MYMYLNILLLMMLRFKMHCNIIQLSKMSNEKLKTLINLYGKKKRTQVKTPFFVINLIFHFPLNEL